MIVVGVDPGTATTGWGVIRTVDSSKLIVDGCGAIITKSQTPFPERLKTIHQELKQIIKQFKPEVAAVEELFFAKNVKTAISVGHARGVILLTAIEEKLGIYEYTPLQVKQSLVGYGRAEKAQMQKMIKVLLGLKEIPHPDDVADALAVAFTHISNAKYHQKTGL
ncbi:MAG: crossover junction endodeoxyribonuclease RuvC [Elusimicrobia bacterium]|nr:crossover junction endodeoxyribonuclease RuvC [Elusimicrobiota bacterium]